MSRAGRWKDAHAAFRELRAETRASVPQWARITRVGRKTGRFISLDLEIHYGNQPPEQVSVTSWLPRGVQPQVGQDVAYRRSDGDDVTTYAVEWDRPPNYGTAPTPQRDAARRLLEAKLALDRGQITQDEFDRVTREG